MTSEEREAALHREAERQRAHADRWHVNMDDAAVARFLKQRRFDPAIPPDRPAEDLAQARDLAALSALALRAPAFGAARSLIEFVRVAVVPVGANLEPTGTPLTSVGQAFTWFDQHPTDGVGVTVNPGILAFKVEKWSLWQTWLHLHDREIRTPLNPDRPEEQRFKVHFEPAPIGTPCRLEWWPPRAPERPFDPIPYRGDAAGREVWDRVTAPFRWSDRGGCLAWACPPDLRFGARELARGLSVLATGNLLPYHVTRADGMTLTKVSGSFTDLDPLKAVPPWLLSEVQASVVARAVKAVSGRSPKKKPAAAKVRGDYDVLDSVPEPTRQPRDSWQPYPDEEF